MVVLQEEQDTGKQRLEEGSEISMPTMVRDGKTPTFV